ncbi:MAG: hypothetical protein HRT38_14615 [Alteromonadaceae bacterium]|nr:hypothetical protein [Alteromonadaceae bacterium]
MDNSEYIKSIEQILQLKNPLFLISKLKNLIDLAKVANSDYEKAAVYSAVRGIEQEFVNGFKHKIPMFALNYIEGIHEINMYICIFIGFDISEKHSQLDCLNLATNELLTLENAMKSYFEK